jgi:ATP-dependent RNA helicase RhlE
MSFENLGLSPHLLRALKEQGYEIATPVQAESIPIVLEGNDLMGCAQTGTGKTAAFALPTLHLLSASNRPQAAASGPRGRQANPAIRALILAPTRELAVQISASFAKYGKFTKLRTAVIYGGVSQVPQVRALQRGVDVLVATPGRLLDLMNQRHVDLTQLEMLILDEADQMLDMGFLPDLKKIVAATPEKRQTLMFSATMPIEIRRLADRWLSSPRTVQVARASATVESIEQSVFFVESRYKPELLTHYLQNNAYERTLVFARTKHGADKIVKHLVRGGIRAAAIHGNKSQSARQRILEQFKSNKPPVLVATDIAARGLDVQGVSHVINYELPEVPEVYVHRIGRTGRAGASGVAASFCGGDERSRLKRIERLISRSMVVEVVDPQYALAPSSQTDDAKSSAGAGRFRKGSGKFSAGKKRKFNQPRAGAGGGEKSYGGQAAAAGGAKPRRKQRRPAAAASKV